MIITYSGRSAPSAMEITIALECAGEDVDLVRGNEGDINWGRRTTSAQLNKNIENVVNKRVMRQLFAEHDVPMPKLYSEEYLCQLFVNGGSGDFVGRPDQHSKGRGFWRIKSITSLNRALLGTRRKKAATHFMEFIDAPREYRVHVFLGKSIRISEKKFCDICPTGSCTDYTTVKPAHNVKHVRKAAKKAVKAVGLDFGAVDILADDNNCWVLEVNAAPGLGGSMPVLYAKVFQEWYENQSTTARIIN